MLNFKFEKEWEVDKKTNTYYNQFYIPTLKPETTLRLEFSGVCSNMKTYINDILVDERGSFFSNFRIDILPYIKEGEMNDIKIEVIEETDKDKIEWLRGLQYDGGIPLTIYLYGHEKEIIENVDIYAVKTISDTTEFEFDIKCNTGAYIFLEFYDNTGERLLGKYFTLFSDKEDPDIIHFWGARPKISDENNKYEYLLKINIMEQNLHNTLYHKKSTYEKRFILTKENIKVQK